MYQRVSKPAHRAVFTLFALVLSITTASAKCSGVDVLPGLAKSHPELSVQVRQEADLILNTNALFWRVKKPGIKASHLFGTMHVADPRITNFSQAARKVLQTSRVLALEIADLSPTAMMKTVAKKPQLMVYTDGTRLDQKLSPAEFEQVTALITKAGMPAKMAPVIRPWLIGIMLGVPECEQKRVARGWSTLDKYIGTLAKAKQVPVIGLETIESQLKAMAAVPDADQVAMLRTSLALLKMREDLFETLIQAYLKRDLGVVLTLSKVMAKIAKLDSSGFAAFSRELINKRNHTMFDTSRPLIDKGNAFIAVGAAHLIGDTGLVALYREAGFTVTAIN